MKGFLTRRRGESAPGRSYTTPKHEHAGAGCVMRRAGEGGAPFSRYLHRAVNDDSPHNPRRPTGARCSSAPFQCSVCSPRACPSSTRPPRVVPGAATAARAISPPAYSAAPLHYVPAGATCPGPARRRCAAPSLPAKMAATATPLIYDFLKHHFGTVKDVVLREKTLASWPVLAVGALVAFLILDQVLYAYKKWRYGYAGPAFTVPFLGGIVEMGEYQLRPTSAGAAQHFPRGRRARAGANYLRMARGVSGEVRPDSWRAFGHQNRAADPPRLPPRTRIRPMGRGRGPGVDCARAPGHGAPGCTRAGLCIRRSRCPCCLRPR
jgi:hypothetical protein